MPSMQVYHGDCLEVMPTLAPGSVAMVFADLPYGISNCRWDSVIPLPPLWDCINAVTIKNGVAAMTAVHPFGAIVICSNLKQFKYDLVWHKKRATQFMHAKRRPLRKHESILIFSRSVGTYNPQMVGGLPYKRSSPPVHRPLYAKGFTTGSDINCSDGQRHPSSVMQCDEADINDMVVNKRMHPTQKPIALLMWLISTYTNPGDTVLDPCFGSNTTGVACKRLGRGYIGIEKDKAYFEAGKARMEAEPWPCAS